MLEILRVGYDHPDAVMLMERVQAIYVELYGSGDAATMDPAEFTPPAGEFFVGYVEGRPVASGAWRQRGDVPGLATVAELKRMYVVEEAQRRGHARTMLAHLEAAAAAAGHAVLVLNTGPLQPEGIALYRSSGYERLAAGWGPYACHPEALFFAKRLTCLPEL